jgi:hypothetical protein
MARSTSRKMSSNGGKFDHVDLYLCRHDNVVPILPTEISLGYPVQPGFTDDRKPAALAMMSGVFSVMPCGYWTLALWF